MSVISRIIVEVETGDGEVRLRVSRLLLDGDRLPRDVHLDDAVAFGIRHDVAEHAGAGTASDRVGEQLGHTVAIEDVVAQHQGHAVVTDEVPPDDEGFGKPIGRRLHRVGDGDTARLATPQPLLEQRLIVRRRDDQHVANACRHQRAERVVDHRLVVDRQKLLRYHERQRVQACAGASSEDDPFHSRSFVHVVRRSNRFDGIRQALDVVLRSAWPFDQPHHQPA